MTKAAIQEAAPNEAPNGNHEKAALVAIRDEGDPVHDTLGRGVLGGILPTGGTASCATR